MAARRERTTALPRAHPKVKAPHGRRILGMTFTERHGRLAIIGVAALLLLAIIGAFAYKIYEDKVARPHETVLTVGNTKYSLGYYRDRLTQFAQANANANSTLALVEQDLLNKLQDEALTVQLAKDQGITVAPDDITKSIADSLGVPVGGDGSAFDTLYRQRLKTLHISDDNFRKLTEAQVANDKLLAKYKADLGTKGDQYVLRTVVLTAQDKATAILGRAQGGEDLGTIAQKESQDLEGRGKDGLMDPEPLGLLPDSVQKAVAGKKVGDLLGPIQVDTNWWVFRIEKLEPTDYSDAQKSQLAQQQLDKALAEKRANTKIETDLSASDITWAEKNLK